MGHAWMENRHGLVVKADTNQFNGYVERKAAFANLEAQTPGAEKRLTLST